MGDGFWGVFGMVFGVYRGWVLGCMGWFWGCIGAYADKRRAAGAHFPIPCFFRLHTLRRLSQLLCGMQFPPLVLAPGTRFYS